MTVKVCPAMVSVPDRAGPVDAAVANAIVPGPFPFCPDVIAIQEALLPADQRQPASVATEMLPVPPLAATLWLVGVIDAVQP